ncbi:uncharacterized protein LOC126835733 [Adelges cooleyi]|uniref:uncharacterized protein LOC126835733 n=1 Tax=Adelges cooleyi TaxID=133065 RepID=UPI00217F38DE|nr:uncharacterized protein LOC126835733 [Adelges cooleyi]
MSQLALLTLVFITTYLKLDAAHVGIHSLYGYDEDNPTLSLYNRQATLPKVINSVDIQSRLIPTYFTPVDLWQNLINSIYRLQTSSDMTTQNPLENKKKSSTLNKQLPSQQEDSLENTVLKFLKSSVHQLRNDYVHELQQVLSVDKTITCCQNGKCTVVRELKECNTEHIKLQTQPVEIDNKNTSEPKTFHKPLNITQSNSTVQKLDDSTAELPDDEVEIIRKDILLATNNLRAKHQSSELLINGEMNAYAQEWSNSIATTNIIKHRPDPHQYGENIFSSSAYLVNMGEVAVQSWYDEIDLDGGYNFEGDEKEMSKNSSLHFTQVIWKNTKEIGIGVSKMGNGWYIIVVNYSPPGNVVGFFKENVLPKKDSE